MGKTRRMKGKSEEWLGGGRERGRRKD